MKNCCNNSNGYTINKKILLLLFSILVSPFLPFIIFYIFFIRKTKNENI